MLVVALLAACSTRKSSENKNVGLKGFSAYYNTLFNSKDALETELKNRKKNHRDNFYAPYIRLLTTDEEPLGTDIDNEMGGREGIGMGAAPGLPQQNKNVSILEISEAKALKALQKYSVMKNGEEKNKMMFDASILLAQSRLYQNKPLEALDALNYLFVNMKNDKRLDLAKIYQAESFAQMKDYYRANEIFLSLNDLSKSHERLKTIYYSQMLVDAGKNEEAIAELENAYNANGDRKTRSRIAFLRGQVLASMGKNEEARESFTSAYKISNDFEFEVKSQVEIAKTFNGKNDDYEGAREYLEDISKKGTYASRKNEFYYALGLMALNAGKNDEAQEFFRKALAEKMSDPQMRGLTYYEIGKNYLNQKDYISAGAYYDSAVAAMNYEPTRAQVTELASNIKKIRDNYYLIKKNDSILAITKMGDAEKQAYFSKYIAELQAKEAKAEALRKSEERSKGFDIGDYNANSIFAGGNTGFQDFGASKGGFYFANQSTVSKGEANFRQVWGNRAEQDNWRYSNRTTSLQDVKNETQGLTTTQDSRRFEPQFYIEKLPTDEKVLLQMKMDRETASLGLARMYDAYFSDTPLATKTLYDLVDASPEKEIKLQALYQAFAMNYEKNPAAAERAKNMILSEFPYTSYAEFVKNPKNNSFTKSAPAVESAYRQAFDLYSAGKFDESRALVESSLSQYPQDALVPKFTLLNAYNTGKTAGKEIMILQLEQLALNYKNTAEGEKARNLLNYLKSDITIENTDINGRVIDNVDAAGRVVNPETGVPADPKSTSMVVQQNATQPVPQINTTENVVKPLQNSTMPTSPPVKANDTNGIPPRPPGMPVNNGIGVPEMRPDELKKIKNE